MAASPPPPPFTTTAGAAAAAVAAAGTPTEHANPTPPAWRKVLYAPQPWEDSFTGARFLEALVVNATVPQRSYWAVVRASMPVAQELSAVAAVGSASYALYQGELSGRHLLALDALLAAAGTALYALASLGASRAALLPHAGLGRLLEAVPSAAALAAAVLLLAPLMATLTQSISPDSILACACLLLVAHLYLSDYRLGGSVGAAAPITCSGSGAESLSSSSRNVASSGSGSSLGGGSSSSSLAGSLGLAAALCASVLLASRLGGGNSDAVAAQLLLSLLLYVLGPRLRAAVAAAGAAPHACLTAAGGAAVAAVLWRQSVLLTSSFVCGQAFVCLICPMWVVRIHKFKAQISGPWDEAAPRLPQRRRATPDW